MLPVVTIVGRSNVGKSTLFNCLTQTMNALVLDLPGTTRDRQYGKGHIGPIPYLVVDTCGFGVENNDIDKKMYYQSWVAILQADLILLVVDAHSGLTVADIELSQKLRKIHKLIYLVVNKTDGLDPVIAVSDFYTLGIEVLFSISAAHNRGIRQLSERFCKALSKCMINMECAEQDKIGIKIAVIGRPNVGKSTLINRLLREERLVVFDAPGTTRDSIYVSLKKNELYYTFIDTVGFRRKTKVTEMVEKFSVIKALQAIEACHIAFVLIDATIGVTDQDLRIIRFVITTGRGLILVINKWDGISECSRNAIKKSLVHRLKFADFAVKYFISALNGTGVAQLFRAAEVVYGSAYRKLSTSQLTRILQLLVERHVPPLAQGRRIKLNYAHAGGQNPPRILIHGNQTEKLAESYKRYLMNGFRAHLKLIGTPICLEFKTSDNPYKGKKNY